MASAWPQDAAYAWVCTHADGEWIVNPGGGQQHWWCTLCNKRAPPEHIASQWHRAAVTSFMSLTNAEREEHIDLCLAHPERAAAQDLACAQPQPNHALLRWVGLFRALRLRDSVWEPGPRQPTCLEGPRPFKVRGPPPPPPPPPPPIKAATHYGGGFDPSAPPKAVPAWKAVQGNAKAPPPNLRYPPPKAPPRGPDGDQIAGEHRSYWRWPPPPPPPPPPPCLVPHDSESDGSDKQHVRILMYDI
jgi:hypothetical protein